MGWGRPSPSTVTSGSATPSRLARSRCESRWTRVGDSRGPSERAMPGSVASSASRHFGRAGPARAAHRLPSAPFNCSNLMSSGCGPRLALVAQHGPYRAGLDGWGDGPMERLQWWLLLLSAVMFSMSGCASVREWCREGAPGRAPCSMLYASAHHMAFSMKSTKTEASITEADRQAALREGWWGRIVPPQEKPAIESASAPTPADKGAPDDVPADGAADAGKRVAVNRSAERHEPRASEQISKELADMTGRWRGQWMANGAWGERREADAEMVFVQTGNKGTAHMNLANTVAAVGVPEVVRYLGALGTPMNLRVSRGEVLARFENGPAVTVRFKRVGDRLYGRIDGSPSFLLVLDRQ